MYLILALQNLIAPELLQIMYLILALQNLNAPEWLQIMYLKSILSK